MLKANRVNWVGIGSLAMLALSGAAACSSSSTPPYGTMDAATPAVDGAAQTGAEGGGGDVTLTVMNFLSWCSVTVNGGTASTAGSMTTSVAAGSTATIVATPASSSFEIGADPWFGVTQNAGGAAPGTDNGSGTSETSTATVVVAGDQCVSVCCQEPGNSPTPCPSTNPCP
jgi:hypothetical protein